MKRAKGVFSILLLLMIGPFAARPHALNPDSIDRYVEATLTPTQIVLVYQIVFGLNGTEDASRRLDPDDDGVITENERSRYVEAEGKRYGGRQYLKVGDQTLALEFRMGDAYAHYGHNGMHVIKADFGFVSPLPASVPRGATLDFQLKDYELETVPGWKQMQVITQPGAHYDGHIPYRDYQPFDYEILNDKGFAPGTDSIKGLVSFGSASQSGDIQIILPERTVMEAPPNLAMQYVVLGGVGIFLFVFIGAIVMKVRR